MAIQVEPETVGEVFRVLDLAGVLGNALLGGLIARREKLDPVGFVTLAVLSGLGGGLLRDTLLQAGTPVALVDPAYLLTALIGAGLAYLVRVDGRAWARVWPVVDALALGCWASVGAQKTLDVGLGWVPAILLGTITAVGGRCRARRRAATHPGRPRREHLVRNVRRRRQRRAGDPLLARSSQRRFVGRAGGRCRAVPGRALARVDAPRRRRLVSYSRRPRPLPGRHTAAKK